ncbi:MAG: LysR family transcriptional regulator [Pseudomonadota bacterium]
MRLKEIDANLIVVLDALLIDGSVTKAAERLGRSPSAISHALSNLRDIFQDELFVRAGQRLVPTAKAESLASTIHVVCAGIQSLLREDDPFEPKTADRNLRIACPTVYEPALVPDILCSIHPDAAGIKLTWNSDESIDIVSGLRDDKFQFAVTDTPPQPEASDIYLAPIRKEQLVSIADENHPLAEARVGIRNYRASSHVFVSMNNNTIEDLILSRAALTSVRQAPSALSATLFAKAVGGVVVLPQSVAGKLLNNCGMTEIRQPFQALSVTIYLAWHRRYQNDRCHAWVRERILHVAASKA